MQKRTLKCAEIEVDPKDAMNTACHFYDQAIKPVMVDLVKQMGSTYACSFLYFLSKIIAPPADLEAKVKETMALINPENSNDTKH